MQIIALTFASFAFSLMWLRSQTRYLEVRSQEWKVYNSDRKRVSHEQGLTFYLFKVAAHVQRINKINIRAKEGSCHPADGHLVVLVVNSLHF